MPAENRVITLVADVNARTVAYDDLNEYQDRLVCFVPMSEEEGSLPAGFNGGAWYYGQYTLAPSTTYDIDLSNDYWNDGGILDHNDHQVLAFAAYSTDVNYQPNGASHSPANQTDMQWLDFNLKDGSDEWEPFAGAADIKFAIDSTDGNLTVQNTHGATTYYVYVLIFASKSIATAQTGTYRQKSMADYARVDSQMLKKMQDRAVMLDEANQGDGALPAAFLGGTWYYGEFTVNNGADDKLDSTINWQNRMWLGFYCDVAAANELPSQSSHDPTQVTNTDWTLHCPKGGDPVGGAFTLSWNPIANVDIYADSVSGDLYCTNGAVGPVYFWLMILATDPIS